MLGHERSPSLAGEARKRVSTEPKWAPRPASCLQQQARHHCAVGCEAPADSLPSSPSPSEALGCISLVCGGTAAFASNSTPFSGFSRTFRYCPGVKRPEWFNSHGLEYRIMSSILKGAFRMQCRRELTGRFGPCPSSPGRDALAVLTKPREATGE